MPGFVVDRDIGGHRIRENSRREYYYNYFWEIQNLFETNFTEGSPMVSLKDATLPVFTVNKEQVQGSSLEYKFAKSVVWEDIKISWYDTLGLLDVLVAWRSTVWTPQCGIKTANEYKKVSTLSTYLPTGQSVNEWVLINSWPSQIRYGDLTYTNSDVKFVEMAVSYDWADETTP